MSKDHHRITRHELHERWTRPHLPIRRVLSTFRELLPNKVWVVAHAMPIRCVAVDPGPERTARTDWPTMCALGTVEIGQWEV